MDLQRPRLFWTYMMRQRPETESNAAGTPTAVLSGPPRDPAQAMTRPRSREPDRLLDVEQATAMLLFSGVALVLVGVTFTFMGWRYHQSNATFEWLKLLGPILIFIGATFALVSACNVGTKFSCFGCRQADDDALQQTSRGHCCTISGRNQPIMIHDVTAILRTPPEYSFMAQDVIPPFGAAFPSRAAVGGIRCEKTENDTGRDGDDGSRPPAYEDIYPSSNQS